MRTLEEREEARRLIVARKTKGYPGDKRKKIQEALAEVLCLSSRQPTVEELEVLWR